MIEIIRILVNQENITECERAFLAEHEDLVQQVKKGGN